MSKVNDQIAALYARRRAQIDEGKGLILSALRKHGRLERHEIRTATNLPTSTMKVAMAELYSEHKLWSFTDGKFEAATETAKL